MQISCLHCLTIRVVPSKPHLYSQDSRNWNLAVCVSPQAYTDLSHARANLGVQQREVMWAAIWAASQGLTGTLGQFSDISLPSRCC